MGFNAISIEKMERVHHGDMVWELGHVTLTGQSEDGSALLNTEEYVVVLKQVDGTWKLHRDVSFAKRQPPPMEMAAEEM